MGIDIFVRNKITVDMTIKEKYAASSNNMFSSILLKFPKILIASIRDGHENITCYLPLHWDLGTILKPTTIVLDRRGDSQKEISES